MLNAVFSLPDKPLSPSQKHHVEMIKAATIKKFDLLIRFRSNTAEWRRKLRFLWRGNLTNQPLFLSLV